MLAEIFLQLGFILWIGIFLSGVKEGIDDYCYSRDKGDLVFMSLISFWVGMFVFFVFGLGML